MSDKSKITRAELLEELSEIESSVYKEIEQDKLRKSMEVLIEAIKGDEDYRRAWHANISMAFQDEYSVLEGLTLGGVRDISNRAADRFLDNLIRVGK